MSVETPDNWVILKIKNDDETFYKVLAGWSGSYLYGDSWRMNSGIVSITEDSHSYHMQRTSGSVYRCGKNSYGVRMNIAGVLNQLQERYPDTVELMPEDTDWMSIDWKG